MSKPIQIASNLVAYAVMAITNHNMEDRGYLDEIARGHMQACELLEFCESFLDVWDERERRFLSAWGAVGQATGRWGQDIGNVTYATAWHHMWQEADTVWKEQSVTYRFL